MDFDLADKMFKDVQRRDVQILHNLQKSVTMTLHIHGCVLENFFPGDFVFAVLYVRAGEADGRLAVAAVEAQTLAWKGRKNYKSRVYPNYVLQYRQVCHIKSTR